MEEHILGFIFFFFFNQEKLLEKRDGVLSDDCFLFFVFSFSADDCKTRFRAVRVVYE